MSLKLMQRLDALQHLDLSSEALADSRYSTALLFGEARGKMFGVLDGIDPLGKRVSLYAFSGQYNGLWSIPGWVPPLFDIDLWQRMNNPSEQKIKALGHKLKQLQAGSVRYLEIKTRRKQLSQELMIRLHQLYILQNFRGMHSQLHQFFPAHRGIPTGTGDCCAPKLLSFAAQQNIIPLGMTEFYWGKTNKSASRKHGRFYSACAEKCTPLLGFLLCGLDDQQKSHCQKP